MAFIDWNGASRHWKKRKNKGEKMLSKEERKLVKNSMENYPTGVRSNAWGFGPMENEDKYVTEFDEEELIKYG